MVAGLQIVTARTVIEKTTPIAIETIGAVEARCLFMGVA
jgi:hypothetical protein